MTADRSPASRQPRVTRLDKALADIREHLDWLREHRSPAGHAHRDTDLAREVGVMECGDILVRHGARHHANTASETPEEGSR